MSPLELKIAMLRMGVRQKAVAEAAGVTPQAVSGVLAGKDKSRRLVEIIQKMIKERKLLKEAA